MRNRPRLACNEDADNSAYYPTSFRRFCLSNWDRVLETGVTMQEVF